jgi:hypothetical protein
LDESTDTSNQNQRALAAEFEKLGITLKGENTLLNNHAERIKQRIELEAEVNEKLRQSGQVRQTASDAEIEEYKLTQKRNVLYEQELASLGRVINENGKIVKSQVELEGAQKRTIAGIKKEEQARNEQEQALKQFSDMLFKDLPKQGLMLALNQAFDTFAAGVTGAYKATIAYEDALLSGTRGMRVDAAATAAKMQEMAKVTAKLGSSLSGMGDSAMAAGVGMMFLGGPVTMLAGAFMILLGLFGKFAGLQKEQEAAMQERNAELVKKQAEINDKIAAGFTKLGAASIAGADGMSGLLGRLNGMTLAVTDLESYSKVLSENKQNLVGLGGTMVEGVKSFSIVAGDLIKSSLGKTLENMGIGVEEMMGHTIQFMAYQNRLGMKTTGDVSKATGEYILELDRLAAITGTTRKEQEEARETILKEQKVQAALMIAEQNNDTEEIKRLRAVIDTAAILKSKGLTKEAADFSMNQAMKGTITDAGTARMAQAAGGKGGATEMLRNREYDPIKLVESLVGKMRGNEKTLAGTTLLTGGTPLGTENLYALNNFGKSLEKDKADYEAAKKKDPNLGSFNDFLDAQRKVTEGWRQNQVEKERAQRAEQIAKENGILAGQMDTMAKAFQAPADGMMGAAYKMFEAVQKFAEAVFEFMKNPIDNTKDWLYGKDKSQRDAEDLVKKQKELKDTEERIKSLKELNENPEKFKKMAEDKFKLADDELKLKAKVVKDLNDELRANNEKDPEKRKLLVAKAIAAQEEEKLAKEKYKIAKQAIDDTKTGFFSKDKKKELEDLQKSKATLIADTAKLEQQVKTNPPSKTAAGFENKSVGSNAAMAGAGSGGRGGGAGVPGDSGGAGGGSGSKPELKSVTSKSGPSAQVNKNVADSFQNLINYLDKTGYKINDMGGYNDRDVRGQPGVKSAHAKGAAIDINSATNPMSSRLITDMPENIGTIAGNLGLGWGGNWQSKKDSMHFSAARNEGGTLMAKTGGVFDGPPGGYPVELHGREAVVPLPNFGDKVSVENDQSVSKSSLSNVTEESSSGNDFAMMMGDIFAMMENKLDDMIDKLNTSNNYSDKLVKAMV